MSKETFRTLYVDPGEDTGWCMGVAGLLVAAGTTKMWAFADDVWADLTGNASPLGDQGFLREEAFGSYYDAPIGRIVCEDFRIYPWKAKALSWDPVRTARLIGALTFMAHHHRIPFVLQGAKIKERAVAGGAEEFFYRPLHENRHQNDAIMHFWFFVQTELRGDKVSRPEPKPTPEPFLQDVPA